MSDRRIVVVGMHRSGTSALTRVLNLLGLDLGSAGLKGAVPSNATGHWEAEPFIDLDTELLTELGGRWDAPPAATPDEIAAHADGPFGRRARQLVVEHLPARGWVWKDPRASLLLPFWRRVFDDDFEVVIALRAPGQIAASLNARDGLSRWFGLALWERYTRRAIVDSLGLERTFVANDRLLVEPVQEVDRLAQRLSLSGDRSAAVTSIEPSLNHHGGLESIELTLNQESLWATCIEALSGLAPAVGDETPHLQFAFDERAALLDAWQGETDRLKADLAFRVEEVELLRAEMAKRGLETEQLADDVTELRARNAELEAVAAEREARLVELYQRPAVRAEAALRRRLRKD